MKKYLARPLVNRNRRSAESPWFTTTELARSHRWEAGAKIDSTSGRANPSRNRGFSPHTVVSDTAGVDGVLCPKGCQHVASLLTNRHCEEHATNSNHHGDRDRETSDNAVMHTRLLDHVKALGVHEFRRHTDFR